jgi:hypothetical protein
MDTGDANAPLTGFRLHDGYPLPTGATKKDYGGSIPDSWEKRDSA